MTTKQNARDLARTARSEAAAIQNGNKRTIAAIISNWNECVKQAGFMGVFDFPTTGYTRKSQIVADLMRCAGQLDDYCEPNPYAPQTVEQQTRELNAALTRVLDADEAHPEALKMEDFKNSGLRAKMAIRQNEWHRLSAYVQTSRIAHAHTEALEINARRRVAEFFGGLDHAGRQAKIEDAHAEALEMNRICSELYYRYWRWWNVMDQYCRADDLALAHKQALEMNSSFKECA